MKKVIYYSNDQTDDFAELNIRQKQLPPDYPYFTKDPVRKALAFLLYYGLALPLVFLFQKLIYGERIVGRSKLKPYRKTGYFLYGNHTRIAGDAYTPALVAFPRKAFIVANPDCVSIPGIRRIVEDLGAVPIPTTASGMKNFLAAIRTHTEKGHAVMIYPEAHIWPYYTDIRPFRATSFRYPADTGQPVFCFTVTYQKRFLLNRPRTTVYIDGPFFASPQDSPKQNQLYLRNCCFEAMSLRAQSSTFHYVTYIQKGGGNSLCPHPANRP